VTLAIPNESVLDVRFAADGRTLSCITVEGNAAVWDVGRPKPKQISRKQVGPLAAASLSPLGGCVATVDATGKLRVIDLSTGKTRCACQAHSLAAVTVSYSPDGRWIATGSADKTVRVWNSETADPRLTLSGHMHSIRAIAFSPDGRRIVSVGADNLLKLWTADTGKELYEQRIPASNPTNVVFSADNQYLAATFGNEIRLWHAPRPRVDQAE
jgi:WD40 repeat protein